MDIMKQLALIVLTRIMFMEYWDFGHLHRDGIWYEAGNQAGNPDSDRDGRRRGCVQDTAGTSQPPADCLRLKITGGSLPVAGYSHLNSLCCIKNPLSLDEISASGPVGFRSIRILLTRWRAASRRLYRRNSALSG